MYRWPMPVSRIDQLASPTAGTEVTEVLFVPPAEDACSILSASPQAASDSAEHATRATTRIDLNLIPVQKVARPEHGSVLTAAKINHPVVHRRIFGRMN